VHAGEEGHARPGWTTSRRGQDSPWKSQSCPWVGFTHRLGWVGSGCVKIFPLVVVWVSELMGWVGSGHTKWTQIDNSGKSRSE